MRRHPVTFYVVASVVTIALGLSIRRFPDAFPSFIARYAPDALWASLVFWLISTAFLRARPLVVAAAALLFSVTVETSQLYHAPWIDAVRATRLGALVLGSGFLWSDLACYAVGVALAAGVDIGLGNKSTPQASEASTGASDADDAFGRDSH
jgi:uncharacterized protein DUF2809